MTERNKQHPEEGFALITVMLLLLLLTIMGIAAIGSSTIENMLAGNMRMRERNVTKGDAGTAISMPIVERALREDDVMGFETIVKDANLPTELRGNPFDPDDWTTAPPDIRFSLNNGQTVTVDVDKMYSQFSAGSAIEFASGYEGVGKSAAGSGFKTYFKVNATVSAAVGQPTTVGMIYRYIPK